MMSSPSCPEATLQTEADLLNLLEPPELVQTFLEHPPEGFEAITLETGAKPLYGFLARLDPLTTVDRTLRKVGRRLRRLLPPVLDRRFTPRVLFIGTTVSEYALFPGAADPQALVDAALTALRDSGRQFLIFKDIPQRSPLLSGRENAFSDALTERLRRSGFLILCGQGLAFVPVNFRSRQEYLARFSPAHRKDIRRKLRSSSRITVEAVRTGDDSFTEARVNLLYGLYRNVYERSEVHFDLLTAQFFRSAFRDGNSKGIVFLYRVQEKIIGFNLCYAAGQALVDKYVGFLYPDSREHNLYFVSWFYNLEYCRENNLKTLITGWTDPEIKAYLGADFTYTIHALYVKNPLLRILLRKLAPLFEADRRLLEKREVK